MSDHSHTDDANRALDEHPITSLIQQTSTYQTAIAAVALAGIVLVFDAGEHAEAIRLLGLLALAVVLHFAYVNRGWLRRKVGLRPRGDRDVE